ncbi:MAG TPA: hypothetical protein VFS95_05260 [Telluria sp.]|nr:hypothetical protein [Telluria sp.]
MKMFRLSRLLVAGITLFSLLFTQLAVAAYACPALSTATPASLVFDRDMPDCQGMQPEQKAPGLCAAHCEKTPQSADTPSVPAVAPFIQGALTVVLAQDDSVLAWTPPPAGFQLLRTGAPPLSIRNCCFRI